MPGTQDKGPCVLLVEDDTVLASLVERLLTGAGYSVVVAGSAHACVNLALTSDVDAMVLDRRLPDGDGLEVLGRLRARGVVLPTVVLTAQGSVGLRASAASALLLRAGVGGVSFSKRTARMPAYFYRESRALAASP